jgi:hypothetical protein
MYKVQSFSKFHDTWVDYRAITHNSHVRKFSKRETAEVYKAGLGSLHPRDIFRIVEVL